MLFHLILGRSGSGKSHEVLRRIKEEGAARAQILLVPEQASYESERRLCEVGGNQAAGYAEVFSFTSLTRRVFSLAGGAARPVLDEGGRLLVMYAAVHAVGSLLTVFGPSAQKAEFLTQLIITIDELKSSCTSPDQLREIASYAEGLAARRLEDLALIYGAYDAMTAQGAADPRDQLTLLVDKLHHTSILQGKDCYLDGFTDFTPQEELVIRELMLQSHSLTVALSCDALDPSNDPHGIFASARQTALRLLRLAEQYHIPIQVETCTRGADTRSPVLAHIEKYLFDDTAPPFDGDTHPLCLTAAKHRRDEVIWVAGQIRSLLQSGRVRARDIAVSARDLEPYRDLITATFARFEIPVFQSDMQPILHKPIFTLITAALDVVAGNFDYEDVFRYLKTGLTGLAPQDCDALENYVLLWNIRGKEWTSERGFFRHPRGYEQTFTEADEALLRHLNEIRRKVISPYMIMKEESSQFIHSKVKSLYNFLENIHLPETLSAHTEALFKRGEPERAMEYRQLWDILCNALTQCVSHLPDMPVRAEEFPRLLRLLLSQYTVGSIPVSLDRVITGDLPRLANRRVGTLFILGADDAGIPQTIPTHGLFSDEDRALLSDYGITLSPAPEMQMLREMTILYTACSQPQQRLFVSWPMMTEGGAEGFPSILVNRLSALLPQLQHQAQPSGVPDPGTLQRMALQDSILQERMRHVEQYRSFVQRATRAAAWRRGDLSAETVRKLYGQGIALSPSRLDRHQSCRFSYFMQYGLQAKPRKAAGFHAPEYGTFIHYVLEYVLRAAAAHGPLSQLEDATLSTLCQEAIRRYTFEQLGGLDGQTPRFRYLFHRLEKTVFLVVQNVVAELQQSDFQPLYFELGFGEGKQLPPVRIQEGDLSLRISGYVDRVDAWVKDDRLYLKVVDYKTGRKSFDLNDIRHGLGLQLLLYAFALEDHAEAFGGLTPVPAGVLYLPARDVLISGSRSMSDQTLQKLVDKELTRRGLLLNDPAVLEALEQPGEGGPRFLPVRLSSKTGAFSGEALVSAEQLGHLRRHVQNILKEVCRSLQQGQVRADPYWRSPTRHACLYCDFAEACHFDERLGEDRRRYIPSQKNSEFWAYLEENGGEEP